MRMTIKYMIVSDAKQDWCCCTCSGFLLILAYLSSTFSLVIKVQQYVILMERFVFALYTMLIVVCHAHCARYSNLCVEPDLLGRNHGVN